ncbi:hypothetical protein GH722_03390 [Alphaproteobacteria bacterium HT1-32]|nr:hypothetical protein [Alphaproteobacteria bacterium HT1-32]
MTDVTETAPVQVSKLRAGSVIARTFSVMFSNFPAFMFLAVMLSLIPLIFQVLLGGVPSLDSSNVAYNMQQDVLALSLVVGFLSIMLSYVAQGAIVYGAVRSLDDQKTSFTECVGRGLVLALPLLAIVILYSLGLIVSFMLLVVPAAIFFCVYFVVIPVAVMEKPGIFRSFSRSAELTRGNRWRIFGLMALSLLIFFALAFGFGLVIGIIIAFAGPGADALLAGALIEAVINAVIMVFFASLVSVTYYDLRHFEGGANLEKLSSVFD